MDEARAFSAEHKKKKQRFASFFDFIKKYETARCSRIGTNNSSQGTSWQCEKAQRRSYNITSLTRRTVY